MLELPLGLILGLAALGAIAFLLTKAKLTKWQRVGYVCFLILLYISYRVSPYSALIVYLLALAVVYALHFGLRNQAGTSRALTALRCIPAPVIALALYLAAVWIVPYQYGVVWELNGDRDQIKQNPITGQTLQYVAVNREWVDASPPCGHLNTPPDFPPRDPGTIRPWTIKVHECGDYNVEWGANPEPSYLPHTLPPPQQQATTAVPSTPKPLPDAFSPSGAMSEQKLGDYAIRIYSGSSDELAGGFLEILQAGRRVYTGQQESFDIDDTGAPLGADVTGTGNPNLVVKEYSGGAHCCTSFEVFSLGSNFQKLATIENADCDGSHFQRQNHGGYAFSLLSGETRAVSV
jgi:hypothetical protein